LVTLPSSSKYSFLPPLSLRQAGPLFLLHILGVPLAPGMQRGGVAGCVFSQVLDRQAQALDQQVEDGSHPGEMGFFPQGLQETREVWCRRRASGEHLERVCGGVVATRYTATKARVEGLVVEKS
jgi:hypothetical protein